MHNLNRDLRLSSRNLASSQESIILQIFSLIFIGRILSRWHMMMMHDHLRVVREALITISCGIEGKHVVYLMLKSF